MPGTLAGWLTGPEEAWPVPAEGPLVARSFTAIVGDAEPELAKLLAPIEKHILPGPCVPLFVPSQCADGTILFLYLPLGDEAGEAPVLGYDPSDDGLVGVFAPRFDHYLARVLGVVPQPVTFAPLPETEPFLHALLGSMPARVRKKVRHDQGVLAVGGLLAVGGS